MDVCYYTEQWELIAALGIVRGALLAGDVLWGLIVKVRASRRKIASQPVTHRIKRKIRELRIERPSWVVSIMRYGGASLGVIALILWIAC